MSLELDSRATMIYWHICRFVSSAVESVFRGMALWMYLRDEATMSTRVLVINDEVSILELFRLVLEPEGYEVHTSEETIENLEEVEHLRPDLVILDLKLGAQEEGWVMMQKLRMYPPTQNIPIILCTAALNEAREQEEMLRDKGIPVVYKPFSVDELLAAVHTILPPAKKAGPKKQ